MSNSTKQRAVFLDRDGTLIEEVNFLSRLEDLKFFPFTQEALNLFRRSGYLVIVVTNQSGIGRKIFDEPAMHAIHDAIQNALDNPPEGFYFCPHLPGEGCSCRKPGRGMIDQACEDFEIDLENSWMVGDKRIDVETGLNAGLRTALVLTGYGSSHVNELKQEPDIIAHDLLEAARLIIEANGR